jgi:hypothetical protein
MNSRALGIIQQEGKLSKSTVAKAKTTSARENMRDRYIQSLSKAEQSLHYSALKARIVRDNELLEEIIYVASSNADKTYFNMDELRHHTNKMTRSGSIDKEVGNLLQQECEMLFQAAKKMSDRVHALANAVREDDDNSNQLITDVVDRVMHAAEAGNS